MTKKFLTLVPKHVAVLSIDQKQNRSLFIQIYQKRLSYIKNLTVSIERMTANSALVTEIENRSFVFWILFATAVQVMNKLGEYGK